MDEQPETENVETTQADGPEISDILSQGLKDIDASPEDGEQPEEKPETDQPVDSDPLKEEKGEGNLFAELIVKEGQKLGFKTEDELNQFIEQNQILKDRGLRLDDYTRKTQEIKTKQTELEESLKADDALYGDIKPDQASKKAFGDLWRVYQACSPEQAQVIRSVFDDATRILNGHQATGILSQFGQDQSTQDGAADPRLTNLQNHNFQLTQHVQRLEKRLEEFETGIKNREVQKVQSEANRQVDEWISGMKSKNIKVDDTELRLMGTYAASLMAEGVINPATNKPYSLDDLYGLARANLGKTKIDAVKGVIVNAQKQKAKSQNPPTSKASGDIEPEPKDILGILEQGAKKLAV